MRYDLIVFDWDGTLIDSTGLIAHCIRTAAAELGLAVPDEQAAKHIIGLGLNDATMGLFPELAHAERMRFAERFRYHYVVRDHEAPLYEGVDELLQFLRLQDRFLAIATGKPRAGLDRALDRTGLKDMFDFTRCADEGFPKPNPDMLERLMDFCGVTPDCVLMIGDTTHDIQLARNARTDVVAVEYGAHPAAYLRDHAPLASFATVEDLHQWLMHNA
jgi:phosphoglycolate phosphatase